MATTGANQAGATGGPIILYDGVCGLCNRLVQFVLRQDRRNRFRFAPLQGAFAAGVLARHGRDPNDLDTMYVVLDPGQPTERLVRKSRAVLRVLRELGGFWGLSLAFALLPTRLLDLAYDAVARRRYRLFGKHESCLVPDAKVRAKFLES